MLSRGSIVLAVICLLLCAGHTHAVFQQNTQGLVSMEAENAQRNTPQGSDQWVLDTAPAGFSGSGVMVTTPNNGTSVTSGFVLNSPRLDFDVNFQQTGTHYLWIRANAPSFADDSVHAGLNGQETPTASGIFLPGGGYSWSGGSETVTIQNTGLNTINLWMREDGARIDKIVLTTDASFVPTGAGPNESPQDSGANLPPTARDDSFSVTEGSSANSLAVLADNGNGADFDPNGDPLSVDSVGATSNGGTATVNGAGNGIIYTPLSTYTGLETFSYTISDDQGETASATVTVNVTSTGGGSGRFLQNAQGLVSMEAENAQGNTPQGSDQWVVDTAPAGFSGSGVMVTTPNNGTSVTSGFVLNSPRLDFEVTFQQTGTHYLWIRANAPSFADDSVHAGLNGQAVPTATGIFLPGGGYSWSGGSETITIANSGPQTINLWMREDGARIDKIVLTTDASFVPTGAGPNESPQDSGGNLAPVAQDDGFSVTEGSSANNLAVLADNGNGADFDPNGDPLSVDSVGPTSNGGTATVNGAGNGIIYTPLSTYTGLETFSYTISDDQGETASATVTVNVTSTGGGSGRFLQNAQGLVSMEAENAQGNTPQGSDQWVVDTAPAGFSGSGVMVTTPNNGTSVTSGFVLNSPRLDFEVTFQQTGTHYLWIRANAPSFADDSVHAGLNGQAVPTATGIFLPGGGYSWSGGSETITIANSGPQTINLWMREDGARIDKIVLTTDASFVPTGAGPNESPQDSGGNQTPVARDDMFAVVEGSSAVNLAVLLDNGNGPDFDPDSDPLSVDSVGPTSNGGTATVNGAGNGIIYTPLSTYTGLETFSYTISDDQGETASATVTVNVTPSGGNQPPVAQNDGFAVVQGVTTVNLAVLADNGNGPDFDPDGDPLTVVSIGSTSGGGTAVINATGNGITYTPLASFTGLETFTYNISDGQGGSDSATVTVSVSPSGGGSGAYLQNSQGLVSMEAENAFRNIPQGSDQWTQETTPLGFSGSGVMVALPNNGTIVTSGFTSNSPQLDFDVSFQQAGTHYLWIRANGPSFADDSVHAGLNGQAVATATGIFLPGGGYTWSSGTNTINIPSTGQHTINLWMREDGARIDKLVLTSDPGFVPTGAGPSESARAGQCQSFPSVQLTSPSQGQLQSSTTIDAAAQGCLDPTLHATWGILFELDGGPSAGGQELLDFTEPYSVSFSGVTKAEHTIGAFVVDGSGCKIGGSGCEDSGENTSDLVTDVGVGDYYVAIGDSITFGFGDDVASDDTSADGRNSGGGYTPILNDLLTSALSYPHTVVNEGVEGITSAGGLLALPAVISAHPQAQRFLVKYGMNDARPSLPVPSGLGLNPGDGGYPGSFKANLQSIIDLVNAASTPTSPKEVVLAKVNIALADGAFDTDLYPDPDQGARSLLIQEYNQVIDELIAVPGNNVSITAPDFYSYFLLNYPTEYSDNIHPNGIGYQSMGDLWLQVLIP